MAAAIQNLTASVDGAVKESWLLILKHGDSRNTTFSVLFEEEGVYTVKIGDETFTISVKQAPPAKLEVTSLRIEPENPKAGEQVTVTVRVGNTGGETGTRNVTLEIGGSLVDARRVTLGPGESTTLTFHYTPQSGEPTRWK